MQYPVLLIRIGSAGLVLAARWSQNGRAPTRGTTATLEVEREELQPDALENAVPERPETPPAQVLARGTCGGSR